MHKYKIGLEVHVQLNTKYKLFSSSLNIFSNDANTYVDIFDLALPGTFPRINKEAIIKAIRMCCLLKTNLADKLCFDRKHYYYPDLPSGYQITQYEKPIGINGVYYLQNNKAIKILDAHLECDAGKLKRYISKDNNLSIPNRLQIDYNRCGVPLVEVVTDCVFNDYSEIYEFLVLFMNDLKINDISNTRLEQGNFRVDVNISRVIRDNITTGRYEIKNINSTNNIQKAITFAKNKLLDCDENSKSMTFNYESDDIVPSREKHSAVQYMYMYEPSLYPVPLSVFIDKLPEVKYTLDMLRNNIINIPNIESNILLIVLCDNDLKILLDYILEFVDINNRKNIVYFVMENRSLFREYGDLKDKLLRLLKEACTIINNKKATKINIIQGIKYMLEDIKNTHVNLTQWLQQNDLVITDIQINENMIIKYVLENFASIEHFKLSDQRALNFMIGYVMKKIKGARPVIIKQMLMNIKNSNSNVK